MKTDIANLLLNNVNGNTFISINTCTIVKGLRGGKQNPHQGLITKTNFGSVVQVFQNKHSNGYENMVKRRLEQEGKDSDDFVLSARTWGRRIPSSCFIEHNGDYYVEVIFKKSGEVKYQLSGENIEKQLIQGLVEKPESEQGGLSDENKVIIRTFRVDSIVGITIGGQHYDNLTFDSDLVTIHEKRVKGEL